MKRRLISPLALRILILAFVTTGFAATVRAAVQQWMDYFQPTPIIGSLSSTCWGAAQVGPRDQSNGLEDTSMKDWNYWDGGIIKDEQTGMYHMFASRWNQADGHGGWMYDSHCVHATSTNIYGPYNDEGQCFTDNGGMCHNVNALKLKSGDTSGKKFAITCSGSVAGSGRVYGADSLDGPWTYLGDLELDLNGHTGRYSSGDNFRTILRPDGQYECINGLIGLADNVLGPYKAQMSGKFTDVVPGHIPDSCKNNMEDPYLFYSGTQYHVFYNCWSAKQAFFYSSADGINWTMEDGYGYDPTSNMVRYTDGTINHWELLERPSVYVENGHAVAMTFAAINVPKDQDTGNSGNGSKVIVVPVDGQSFDSGNPPGTGTGGSAGSGGSSGAGGTPPGGGGASGSGGAGGASAAAGSSGSGDASGAGTTGGTSGGGGATGSGGRSGSGGEASGGVVSSSGGIVSSSGGAGSPTGGSMTGGVTASGGQPGAGGASTGAGGAPASGGADGTGGGVLDVDAGTTGIDASSDKGGCACGVAVRPSARFNLLAALGVLGMLAFGVRRRRSSPAGASRR